MAMSRFTKLGRNEFGQWIKSLEVSYDVFLFYLTKMIMNLHKSNTRKSRISSKVYADCNAYQIFLVHPGTRKSMFLRYYNIFQKSLLILTIIQFISGGEITDYRLVIVDKSNFSTCIKTISNSLSPCTLSSSLQNDTNAHGYVRCIYLQLI